MKIFSKITASHYVLPTKKLTNEELCLRFDPQKIKRISKLSGIRQRCIAPDGVTSVDLGVEAARRMIEAEKIDKNSIDMLILATQTPDNILPASAFIIHDRLGLPARCGAFDISMGCAAFPYVAGVANGLIASGQCSKILLIFAETISKLINPEDRALVPLHGDGAAAFIFEKSDDAQGLEFVEIGTESSGWRHLIVPDGGMRSPLSHKSYENKIDESGICTSDANLQMNGAAVFHFSISTVPEAIKRTFEKHGLSAADYSLILLHQANKMMLDNIYNAIGATKEQRFLFMEDIGNLSAASTPVLLAEAVRQNKLKDGGKVLLTSFGVGLTWAILSMNIAPNGIKAAEASTEF